MTRYIICRPECGLNDMLNQIEIAYQYGLATNRTVIVDTSHVSSKHFRDNFGHYFDSVDKNLVLDSDHVKNKLNELSVFPYFLTGRLNDYDVEYSDSFNRWVDTKFKFPIAVDFSKNYNESIVVHQQFGGGIQSLDALKKLKLKPWLLEKLKERFNEIPGPYIGVHVRNTDIKSDYKNVIENLKSKNCDRIFVATDSIVALQEFKEAFGDKVYSFSVLLQNTQPLHYLNSNSRERNTDSILDLLMLALSKELYCAELIDCSWSKFSGYSILAMLLHKNNDVLQHLLSANGSSEMIEVIVNNVKTKMTVDDYNQLLKRIADQKTRQQLILKKLETPVVLDRSITNIKMFQICFKSEQLSQVDANFIAYDNTSNERPDLREWYSWKKIHNSELVSDVDYWGAVSLKFTEKTKLSGARFLKFIQDSPGYDIYYVCPSWFNADLTEFNVWVDGDRYHPNLSTIANKVLLKLGYSVDVTKIKMPVFFFCNFFVANKKFWNSYMKTIDRIFYICETDVQLKDDIFAKGKSNYYQEPTAPMFPFLIERLTPTYVLLNNYNSLSFQSVFYNKE